MSKEDSREFHGLSHIEDWVRKELETRQKNIGLSTSPSDVLNYDGSSYKGPKMAWARLVSNAKVTFPGDKQTEKNGFQLFTQDGFDAIYGYRPNGSEFKQGIIGYTKDGKEHTLTDEFNLHRPPPGLQSISTEMLGGNGGKFRKASVKFSVSSKYQLDYMTPFFLVPGITCFIEFGWNNFDPSSLLKLNVRGQVKKKGQEGTGVLGRLTDYKNTHKAQMDSKGNYSCVVGRINNYNYNLRSDGGFDVTLEVMQVGEAIYGLSVEPDSKNKADPSEFSINLSKYLEDNLDKIAENNKDDLGVLPAPLDTAVKKVGKNEIPLKIDDRYFSSKYTIEDEGNQSAKEADAKYISFGLLIDIINYYSELKTGDDVISGFKFDISKSYISATPNLKSIDHSVMIIPNSIAPSLNFDADLNKTSDTSNSEGTSLREANDALKLAVGSSKISTDRIDITEFFPLKGNCKFPELTDFSLDEIKYGIGGYWGKLENLYINIKIIKNTIKSSKRIVDFVESILEKMSGAACDIWDFEIKGKTNGEVDLDCTIVDNNFAVDSTRFKNETYTFNPLATNSILKNLTFGINLPDSVATQTIMDSSSSTDSRKEATFFSQIKGQTVKVYDEYLNDMVVNETEGNKKSKVEPDKILAKNFDNDYFTIKSSDGNIFKLAEPNKKLMQNLINLDKSPNNNAIYNGMVPGVEVELELLGISGLRFLNVFSLEGIPDIYSKNGVYQIKNVKHSVSDHIWTTVVTAGLRPFPTVLEKKKV
jgi:hypothetical protein